MEVKWAGILKELVQRAVGSLLWLIPMMLEISTLTETGTTVKADRD